MFDISQLKADTLLQKGTSEKANKSLGNEICFKAGLNRRRGGRDLERELLGFDWDEGMEGCTKGQGF